MGTKVTNEEFEMLFASCGHDVNNVMEKEKYYIVKINECIIEVSDLKRLSIKGLSIKSIIVGNDGNLQIIYKKLY